MDPARIPIAPLDELRAELNRLTNYRDGLDRCRRGAFAAGAGPLQEWTVELMLTNRDIDRIAAEIERREAIIPNGR